MMDSVSIRVESPLQALMAEQAVAMAKQLEAASRAVPDGKVLSRLQAIRGFVRSLLPTWGRMREPAIAKCRNGSSSKGLNAGKDHDLDQLG